MPQKTVVITTCDICYEQINTNQEYVNAGPYGVYLHLKCMLEASSAKIIVTLNLDDIKIMKGEDWDSAVKAVSWLRKNDFR